MMPNGRKGIILTVYLPHIITVRGCMSEDNRGRSLDQMHIKIDAIVPIIRCCLLLRPCIHIGSHRYTFYIKSPIYHFSSFKGVVCAVESLRKEHFTVAARYLKVVEIGSFRPPIASLGIRLSHAYSPIFELSITLVYLYSVKISHGMAPIGDRKS